MSLCHSSPYAARGTLDSVPETRVGKPVQPRRADACEDRWSFTVGRRAGLSADDEEVDDDCRSRATSSLSNPGPDVERAMLAADAIVTHGTSGDHEWWMYDCIANDLDCSTMMVLVMLAAKRRGAHVARGSAVCRFLNALAQNVDEHRLTRAMRHLLATQPPEVGASFLTAVGACEDAAMVCARRALYEADARVVGVVLAPMLDAGLCRHAVAVVRCTCPGVRALVWKETVAALTTVGGLFMAKHVYQDVAKARFKCSDYLHWASAALVAQVQTLEGCMEDLDSPL